MTVAEVAGAIGDAANRTLVRRVVIHDLRMAAWAAAALVIILLGVSAGSYTLGATQAGERYLSADAAVQSALTSGGPATAKRWRDLMAWNDLVQAEAICVRVGNTAKIDGRAACAIPLWTEPPQAARQ
uniref:Protein of unassigned function n=1 Tax=Methylobacterium oryzae CBMB20 TaxID=693986 RepID=A0A088B2E3_9HYPH|nr:protein of unassigned function [Methylobacterium oryzae CBMB20]